MLPAGAFMPSQLQCTTGKPHLREVGFWVHRVKQVLDDIETPVFILGVRGEGNAKK